MAVRFSDGGGESLAPVVPLFPRAVRPSGQEPVRPGSGSAARHEEEGHPDAHAAPATPAWPAWNAVSDEETSVPVAERIDAAEQLLLKRLRARQLSVEEARSLLMERELDADEAEEIVGDFERRGYLDDARLAEQLVHGALSRKAQGARAIAQALTARGISREAVDAVMADLPDDEAERALEFARQKVRAMRSLERDAALRRLHGQLARRGFGGPVAMTAARTALDEAGIGASGPRFR